MRPLSRAAVLATVGCLIVLTGCSSGGSSGAKPRAIANTSPERFEDCQHVECTGSLAGAPYKIEMPDTWNGTLLLWSHGYRAAVPIPPDFTPVERDATDAPTPEVASQLLAQGYAVAGSAYATNGWAVQDGVKAGEDLQQFFRDSIGKPRRTYVWGESLGGLITELLNEKHPEWIAGAAPECGVVAGTTANLDGARALAYMVKTLIDPGLQITGYSDAAQAVAAFRRAQQKIVAAAQDVAGGGTAKVVAIAAIAHLPTQTKTYDGHDAVSQISAKVEAILSEIGYATFGEQEFAQRIHGEGIDIKTLDFAAAVNDADRATVKNFGGDLDTYLAALAAGQRPASDPAARERAHAQGETTGVLAHPTITMHTEQDPLAIVQNERVFGDRVFKAGRIGSLMQLFTKPPATYTAPAPYGAGHCVFSTAEHLALVSALDGWVRTGHRPTPESVKAATTGANGFDPAFGPAPFPLLSS